MSWQAALALATVVGALFAMAAGRVAPARALGGALGLLVIAGAVSPEVALSGFANEAVATVGLLFLVAAAVRRCGALHGLTRAVLGRPRHVALLQSRLVAPVAAASAFLNNTPIVAMLTPEIGAWGRRHGIPASKLLIPLSYAAILGGMCTLIGTSTNLVVDGMLRAIGRDGLDMFELTPVGLPAALVGAGVLLVAGRRLLPARPVYFADDASAFVAELVVRPGGELVGRALHEGPLAHGRTLTPIEIRRHGRRLRAPSSEELLEANDRLVVTAPLAELLSVEHVPGLDLAAHALGPDEAPEDLITVVITARSPLVGAVVGDGSFRQRYGAAVVGVQRGGLELEAGPLSTWRLAAGDRLLVATRRGFAERPEVRAELVLVSVAEPVSRPGSGAQALVLLFLVAMVTTAATGLLSMPRAALATVLGLFACRLLRWRNLREDVDWQVLAAIAAALGLGAALTVTGAAEVIADELVALGQGSPHGALIAIYITTVILTELVTNNAAAAMMLPIALDTAADLGVSWQPFAVAVAIAASASFLTPIGYQTNLIVYGAGGYRFTDFLRLGLPLTVAVAATAIALAPVVFPF